jgi:hypothetical protein
MQRNIDGLPQFSERSVVDSKMTRKPEMEANWKTITALDRPLRSYTRLRITLGFSASAG